ncbi:MAG: SDR family NAD(P)-dependent oxidoreductase [Candidatus Dormibacteria bacterium]
MTRGLPTDTRTDVALLDGDPLGVAGRRVLVTGASRGIGFAIAQEMASKGAVVAIGARGAPQLESAAARLRAQGAEVFAAAVDVTSPASVTRFVGEAAAAMGGLDFVVANAGGSSGGDLTGSTNGDWIDTFNLNVGHAVGLLRSARPHLRESGHGAAVLISSISGSKPAPHGQYGAAKAALNYVAAALARELAGDGIRVNSVSPGSILFPGGGWDRYRKRDPAGFQEFIRHDLPAGRLGTAAEVARVVAFVLSPLASWVNGANIPVDGAQGRPGASGW